MRLSELLCERVIKVGLDATTKWEAIEELTDLIISTGEVHSINRDIMLEAIAERERSLTTGLGQGLAVPHAAVKCADSLLAALGTSRQGIPFESLDGRPAHLIVLLLMPKDAFQRHVRTLAGIADLGADADLRARVLQASEPAEVMELIRDADGRRDVAGG